LFHSKIISIFQKLADKIDSGQAPGKKKQGGQRRRRATIFFDRCIEWWARFALSYCVIIFVACMLRRYCRNKGIVAEFL
jgi:hypothetical protein